eukprot:TRINITY_DN4761_c0_g2_i5.p1 TRINITY_DN4761_c0_g2~~TRINITY_DN4761_c0_g2_i5.p1  ORF type:complete len:217 (-),score=56.43 TRINITY_DN4761_c0_g2_i5:52-702(-)
MDSGKSRTALLVVDVQNDFCEKGSLPVPDGSSVIPVVNSLRASPLIDYFVFTQDWHPVNHCSFKTYKPEEVPAGADRPTTAGPWPPHCVAGERGSEFAPGLEVKPEDIGVKKGTIAYKDSYSAFGNDVDKTYLKELLRALGVTKVYVAGLAYDYCVRSTAEDAKRAGFETCLVADGARAISEQGKKEADESFGKLGIKIVSSSELLEKCVKDSLIL